MTSIVMLSLLLSNPTYGQSQPSNAETKSQIETSLIEFFPSVEIEFNGNWTLALKADEDFLLQTDGNLSSLWNAIDIAKGFGYELNEITTSGMGSEGNPTRFYAIMTYNNTP
jgi:hypothetical protein